MRGGRGGGPGTSWLVRGSSAGLRSTAATALATGVAQPRRIWALVPGSVRGMVVLRDGGRGKLVATSMLARRGAGRAPRPRLWLCVHLASTAGSGEEQCRWWFRWRQQLERDFPPVWFGSVCHGRGWRLKEAAKLRRRWLVVGWMRGCGGCGCGGAVLGRHWSGCWRWWRLVCCVLRRPPSWWSARVSSSGSLGFVILGWEKSLLRDVVACNGDVHGRRPLHGGVALAPIQLPSLCSGETLGPFFGPGNGGAMASFPSWRRRLVARGVPVARLTSVSASTMGMGLLGAMYTIAGAVSMMPSLGPPRPCRPPTDFFLRNRWEYARLI
ncbi:uncharacterized protein [Aegilops tauschii subsp. strangulata]|uniref:uncharacterized protein n=1 Tax=Aegilops tauschii subsp. strangulata TaxID=200361 RepID=UPI003CC8901D